MESARVGTDAFQALSMEGQDFLCALRYVKFDLTSLSKCFHLRIIWDLHCDSSKELSTGTRMRQVTIYRPPALSFTLFGALADLA